MNKNLFWIILNKAEQFGRELNRELEQKKGPNQYPLMTPGYRILLSLNNKIGGKKDIDVAQKKKERKKRNRSDSLTFADNSHVTHKVGHQVVFACDSAVTFYSFSPSSSAQRHLGPSRASQKSCDASKIAAGELRFQLRRDSSGKTPVARLWSAALKPRALIGGNVGCRTNVRKRWAPVPPMQSGLTMSISLTLRLISLFLSLQQNSSRFDTWWNK